MESLSDAAAQASARLRDRRNYAYKSRDDEELESFRIAFRLVDSLLNDMGEVVKELPVELISLRTEAERFLRRYQIYHSDDEDDFRGALAWLHYYGNADDLAVIEAVRDSVSATYPASVARIDGTINAIGLRVNGYKSSGLTGKLPYLIGIAASMILAFLCVSIAYGGFSRYQLLLTCGIGGGFASGMFLLAEGLFHRTTVITRIFFVAASVLMFIETFGIVKGIGIRQ